MFYSLSTADINVAVQSFDTFSAHTDFQIRALYHSTGFQPVPVGDWASDGENWKQAVMDADQWVKDNPRVVGKVVGEIAVEAAEAYLTGGGSLLKKDGKELLEETLEHGGKQLVKEGVGETAEQLAKESVEQGLKKNLPEVITKQGIKDPPGTKRNSAGELIDAKTGRHVKDSNKVPSEKYIRNQAEKRDALLRDAKDPDSGLSERARKVILDSKGHKVPKGYEGVSKVHFWTFYPVHSGCGKGKIKKFLVLTHPLYTSKSLAGKKALDIERNMKTQRKSTHRKRYQVYGNQYHEFGSANNPNPDKMID